MSRRHRDAKAHCRLWAKHVCCLFSPWPSAHMCPTACGTVTAVLTHHQRYESPAGAGSLVRGEDPRQRWSDESHTIQKRTSTRSSFDPFLHPSACSTACPGIYIYMNINHPLFVVILEINCLSLSATASLVPARPFHTKAIDNDSLRYPAYIIVHSEGSTSKYMIPTYVYRSPHDSNAMDENTSCTYSLRLKCVFVRRGL